MRKTDDRLDQGMGDAPQHLPTPHLVAGRVSTPARRTRHTANQQQNLRRERFRVSGFRPEGSEGKQNRTEHNGTRQTPETGALSRHKKIPELTQPARERERARLSASLNGRLGEPKTFWCTDRSRTAALRDAELLLHCLKILQIKICFLHFNNSDVHSSYAEEHF